jgi:predicted DNA-binding antitoxin AbrB/MazE fold protein
LTERTTEDAMSTIQAVFRNGVFEPKEPVDLHEGCEVAIPLQAEESGLERAIIVEGKGPGDEIAEQVREALEKLS